MAPSTSGVGDDPRRREDDPGQAEHHYQGTESKSGSRLSIARRLPERGEYSGRAAQQLSSENENHRLQKIIFHKPYEPGAFRRLPR